MKRIIEHLKYNFRKDNNGLIQLILINVVVFVVLAIIYVISKLTGSIAFDLINYFLTVPRSWSEFIHKPWTILTYSFVHSIPNIFHILFNMLALYWFGNLIQEYIGSRRLVNLYILGAVVGGLIFLILNNHVPFFADKQVLPLAGASGSVFAIAVAAATLVPEYTFYMLFIGPVRILYIVAIYVFISFIGSVGQNPGGDICHLGGALLGFVYIRALRNGTDLGQPINWIASKINRLKNPKLKVSYRKKESDEISQKEIDAILDKINRTGYSSLTKEEKQKLYKASQK